MNGLRAEVDKSSEKIGSKIRDAQLGKVPYMLIVGEKEEKEKTVSVRSRSKGDLGGMEIDALLDGLRKEIDKRE